MNNHLTDDILFKKYIKASKIYGEYGAGDTTYFASIEPTIEEIHSVESDFGWIEATKKRLVRPATFYYKEMDTKFMNWGHPGPNATDEQKRAYSDPIPAPLDFVLIDGRFRVACALKLHAVISDSTIVAFDDFLNRPHYDVVLGYYDVIERGKTMVILKKNKNMIPSKEMIQKYELNVD